MWRDNKQLTSFFLTSSTGFSVFSAEDIMIVWDGMLSNNSSLGKEEMSTT